MAWCADYAESTRYGSRGRSVATGAHWELRKAKFAEYKLTMQQLHEAHKANAELARDFDQAMSP